MASKKGKYSELKVGIVLVVALAIAIVAILKVDEQRGLFGDQYELVTYFNRINGLTVGAPVWLAGVDVGSVTDVQFVSDLEEKKIMVRMSINSTIQDRIRANSVATIESQGLLGSKLVSLTVGDPSEPRLESGDEIYGRMPDDIPQILSDASGVVDDVSFAIREIRKVMGHVEQGRGTVGRLVRDDLLYRKVVQAVDETRRLLEHVITGEGASGRFISDPELYIKINKIIDEIGEGHGLAGKVFKDEEVYQNTVDVASKVKDLLDEVDNGQGTMGKLLKDDEAYFRLIRVLAETERLLIDIRENPDRYVRVEVF
jgi:phospholipid/cholesterol/gamma-HCH transport system substrate-binding protein